MHVSLDSALGRQRRLNSVGDSVLQIAPSAAAAYSLRSLTGGDPKVVRVRRSSGGEKDFTASGVASGAMLSYVIEARTGWNIQPTFNDAPDGTATITSASSTATTSTVSFTGSGTIRVLPKSSYIAAEAGDQVVFNMSVSGLDSAMTFRIRKASSNTTVGTASVSNGDNQDVTMNLTASSGYTGGYPHFTADAGSGEATVTINSVTVNGKSGFVETWYDQSGNNRPLIQTTSGEQPLIVESGVFLNGVKANQATSNDTMQNLQVSTDGTNADFGTDDWASGASLKLGAVYVGTVPAASVATSSQNSIIWGGSRGVGAFQEGGVALSVVKAGTDSWRLRNERQGLSPSTMDVRLSLNTDADVVLYGTTDNREFTINVNGSGSTETESADLDVREGQALSLFGAYNGTDGRYYQRSSGGVCKECYLYAGDPVANIPALATSINAHYSIY